MTVAELLKNEYQSWKKGIYLVNATTGTGKTQFVLNQLYDYAQSNNKKIAMFVNRTILRDQLLENLQSKDIFIATYQKLEFNNYLQNINYSMPLTYDLEDLSSKINEFDYLILDEAHYLFQDSPFNPNTDVIMELIEQFEGIVLMMSATPQILKRFYKDRITKEYKISANYNYIDRIITFDDDKELQEIIAEIPLNEKILYFGGDKAKLQKYRDNFENSDYVSSDNKLTNKSAKQIIETNRFDCRILFATKVLDNGVSIIDESLKHIFIDLDDLITIIQCLGRKRIIGNEKITLYVRRKCKANFLPKWRELQQQMEVYRDYYSGMSMELFADKYRRRELSYFIDTKLEIIRPAEFFFLQRYSFVQSIMEGNITFMYELMGILHRYYPQAYKNIKRRKVLHENLGKRFYKEDRKTLIQMLNFRTDGKLIKQLSSLNDCLKAKELPYKFVSQIDCQRNSDKFKKTYWEIVKMRIVPKISGMYYIIIRQKMEHPSKADWI